MASLTFMPRIRRGLVIGDPYLALIASAAGFNYLIYNGNCSSVREALEKSLPDVGLVIVLRSIYDECVFIREFEEEHRDVLFIQLDDPRMIEKIDPKKYYEELMAKYIGMRFELK